MTESCARHRAGIGIRVNRASGGIFSLSLKIPPVDAGEVARTVGEAAIVEPGPPTDDTRQTITLLGTRRAKIATFQGADGPGACR
jgi:hypothetical protein